MKKAFTLIELMVGLLILGLLVGIGIQIYSGVVKKAECSGNAEQHRKVVNLAKDTYAFCRLNGYTYMNLRPGLTCISNPRSGMTKVSGDGYTNKCIRKWDCKTDWLGRQQNAGLSSGYFFEHVRAEFNEPGHTGSFVRNDQWQNFIKPNYPERPGITNIRDKGDDLHIATFLGEDCSNGNFSNSGGGYKIDEIKWP